MATFAELQAEVLLLVIDTPTAVQTLVPTMVKRAIRKLQVKHNFKCMEAETTFVTTALDRSLGDRPTDWKMPRGNPYYIEQLGPIRDLQWVSARADAQARWGTSTDFDYGCPKGLYEDDLAGVFTIYPYPDSLSDYSDGQYRVVVPYWKYLGDLIAPGDFNWFSVNADQYIIYQATSDCFYANEDEGRAQLWQTRAAMEYKDVVMLDKDRRYGETQQLVPHLGAYKPHVQE